MEEDMFSFDDREMLQQMKFNGASKMAEKTSKTSAVLPNGLSSKAK